MENKAKTSKDYYSIDLMHIARSIIHRLWIIILAAVLAAAAGFSYSTFVLKPVYGAQVLLYVNNSSINFGNTSFDISASDIQASLSLVNTYSVLLKNRTTLERVKENAGVDYTVAELASMIQTGSVNETEVMKVVVTCGNPHEAAKIANSIAEVLPVRVSEIIDGASMVVVDRAVPVTSKIGPSVSRYTFLGLIIGALVTVIIIAVRAIMDDTIYNEDYVLENYDYPILAKVPNLLETHHGSGYGYYYKSNPEPKE
ncbi:MAG: hypothetical protein E7648_06695 [Ruminococcaceae bacterium]|nr:hypothetical protein [Oscillospiraceae bacterium]